MRNIFFSLVLSSITPFIVKGQNMTIYKSKVSVSETTAKIESIIKKKGLIYFETVSHGDIAKDRDIDLEATNVILFEDPVLSSELIVCERTVALDLPLKIMIWEEHGDVYIGYIDPQLMRRRFLINGCNESLNQMTSLMLRIINESLRDN